MRRFSLVCTLVLVATHTATLPAQTNHDKAAPRAVATRQDWFSIPFHIAAARRPDRKPLEVQLFVSDDGGRTWQLHERVSPDAGQVSFQAKRDGRYCFCVRTVDRAGHLHPGGDFQPEMIVVVDTSSPKLSLTAERGSDGAVTARWRIEEAHLDKNSLQLEYKIGAGDGPWQPLAIDATETDADGEVHSGSATWRPAADSDAVTLRATVRDVAGNRADNHARLEAIVETAADAIAQRRGYQDTDQYGNMRRPADIRATPDRVAERRTPSQATAEQQNNLRNDSLPDHLYARRSTNNSAPYPDTQHGRPPVGPLAGAVVDQVHPPVGQQFGPLEGPSLAGSEGLPPGERPRMVNSVRFELEYEVESIGPSGIGRVQLWGTPDGGQSWRSFGVDADNRSPLPVTVDGEGLYGFRIVVESGSGLHSQLPRSGDPPEVWVGVDLSEPEVQLISAEQGTREQAGLLLVQWQADDAQLAVRPVSLLIREQTSGPWSPIASGLPNTGRFAWPLDNRVPDEIFLRLEVRDEAGNVRVVESDQSITLDRARPQGRIRGVRSLPTNPDASAQRRWTNNPFYH